MPYKDPKKQAEYQNAWAQKRRQDWLKDSGPCLWCGSWIDLEVDHIDPTQKVTHRIWTWSKQRRNEELRKCQVLCWQCHIRKTTLQRREHITEHGTYAMYDTMRCRCTPCRAASATYRAELRARQRAA